MKLSHLLFVSIKSLKNFINLSGLLVIIYIVVIVPLIGIGFTISPIINFEIPNFIMEVVLKNKFYSFLYYTLIIIFSYIPFRYVFFHYYLIYKNNIKEDLINSSNIAKGNWKNVFKDIFKDIFEFLFYILLFSISFVLGINFDEIFKIQKDIEIVAYRSRGDLTAENSILGLELEIKENI